MCGLTGFAGFSRNSERYEHDIRAMMNAIQHRGPEEYGYCIDDYGAVGLVRLAIIDLPLGKQPMAFANERYWLVFNGTIVNYLELQADLEADGVRFETDSDTEVLGEALAIWGTQALGRLNGSFAFAFFDRVQRRVLLARDPVGERPLFFSLFDEGIAFSSEIKGIFALPGVARRLSPAGLRQSFKVWSPIDPATCFEGIYSLKPGHCGVFEDGRFTTTPYFRLPVAESTDNIHALSFNEAKERLRETLAESVRIRLRSDFGIGVLVSGGIDSSAIAAVACEELGGPPSTFSFTLRDSRLDESEAQLRLARHLGTAHSSVEVTKELSRSLFPAAVYHAETPLFRPSSVAVGLLAKHVHEHGCRVVLFGPGSDELFCGYDVAKEAAFLAKYEAFDSDTDRKRWLADLFHDSLLTKSLSPDALIAFYSDPGARSSPLGAHFRRFSREPDLSDLARSEVLTPGYWADMICESLVELDPVLFERPLIERSRAIDMLAMSSGWAMQAFADRVTVPEGVEFRAPFFDPNMIRFGWALPEDFTLGGGRSEKRILREAFAGVLPPEVLSRPKQGLRAFGAEALLPMGADDWVQDVISRAVSGDSEIIDPEKAKALVAAISENGSGLRYPLNHSYCLMLSTVVLEDQLVKNFRVAGDSPNLNVVKAVDKRGHTVR